MNKKNDTAELPPLPDIGDMMAKAKIGEQNTMVVPKVEPVVEVVRNREIFAADGLRGLNAYLAAKVAPQYPAKHFAWVDTEQAKQRFRGWTPLRVDFDKNTVTECKWEDAEKTTGNTLCWMDMEKWKLLQIPEEQRRQQLQKEVERDTSELQAKQLNTTLPLPKGMKFSPLDERDDGP